MGSHGVVLPAPLLNDDLCLLETVEDFAVEQLVAQLSVEGLAVAVLPRAAWLYVECLRAHTGQPAAHDLGRHLRAIVGADVFGNTVRNHGIGHGLEHCHAVDPACDTDRQTFPAELIDQGHQPELAAVTGLGLDEVVGPDMVAVFRPQPDAGPVIEPQPAPGLLF